MLDRYGAIFSALTVIIRRRNPTLSGVFSHAGVAKPMFGTLKTQVMCDSCRNWLIPRRQMG
jgi:hypothetical protein